MRILVALRLGQWTIVTAPNVYSLRQGAIDHLGREREHRRVSRGACRKRILHFDLEVKRALLRGIFLLLDLQQNKKKKTLFVVLWWPIRFTRACSHVKWNVQRMCDAPFYRSQWATFNSRYPFPSSFEVSLTGWMSTEIIFVSDTSKAA